MAGYTDSAFRQICKYYGADVVYSEMASATALNFKGKKTLEMLRFKKAENIMSFNFLVIIQSILKTPPKLLPKK